jgi:hypothetical protein
MLRLMRKKGVSKVGRRTNMINVETALKESLSIEGAVGAALVDFESGMSLGTLGGGDWLNLDVAAAGNTEVIRAKMRVMSELSLDDAIEDILITLGRQYHLIRLIGDTGRGGPTLFLYLVLDRSRANLALARHHLRRIEGDLTV